MIHYRFIERGDNAILAALIREVFIEYGADHHSGTILTDPTTDQLFELFQVPGSVCWLAMDMGRIAGCCGIYPTDGLPSKCAELVKFYLLKEWRGKGIGKELLQRSVNSALQLGYESLYLESLPEFDRAVGMYKKFGFEHLDGPLGNSGHFGCTIWMLKRIGDGQ